MIERQSDCQTCFLCGIYCPTDALCVALDAEGPTPVTEDEIETKGLFGSYRRALGGIAASRVGLIMTRPSACASRRDDSMMAGADAVALGSPR